MRAEKIDTKLRALQCEGAYLEQASVFLTSFVAEPEDQRGDVLGLQSRHEV